MDSITLQKYKDTTKRILRMSFPMMRESDFDAANFLYSSTADF